MSGQVEPNFKPPGFARVVPPRRIAPMSKKRRAEIPERQAVVEAVKARDGYRCVAAVRGAPGACQGALVGHERIKRNAWTAGYLDEDNILTVCTYHNGRFEDAVGAERELHRELGLTESASW